MSETTAPLTPIPTAAPRWATVRPWRNNNPGDIRTLPDGQKWDGQTGEDDAPGGPFCIFENRTMGWRALAKTLLTYHQVHGCQTIRQVCLRWAPWSENNTAGYTATVARLSQFGESQDFPFSNPIDVRSLALAIATAEGGSRILWPFDEVVAGINMAFAGT